MIRGDRETGWQSDNRTKSLEACLATAESRSPTAELIGSHPFQGGKNLIESGGVAAALHSIQPHV